MECRVRLCFAPGALFCALGRLSRTTVVVLQQTATVHVCQLRDDLLVRQTKMVITAKQLLNQKVVKELHVDGGEPDGRIDVAVHRAAALQLGELRGEAAPQVVNQPFKHLAKVAVLEFEHVDVHQQPEVVMVVHHLLDLLAEAHERFGLERLVDLVEDRTQATVDGRLILVDDRAENLFFCPVIVIDVAERRPCPGGNIAHRGGVKTLLDEEFLGRFLDPTFVLFDRAGTEFWHSAYKNERPYFIYSGAGVKVKR